MRFIVFAAYFQHICWDAPSPDPQHIYLFRTFIRLLFKASTVIIWHLAKNVKVPQILGCFPPKKLDFLLATIICSRHFAHGFRNMVVYKGPKMVNFTHKNCYLMLPHKMIPAHLCTMIFTLLKSRDHKVIIMCWQHWSLCSFTFTLPMASFWHFTTIQGHSMSLKLAPINILYAIN